jgi:NarL family two-component system response regulator LiaR
MDALKLLLADDHPLVLQGLRRTFESDDDIEVVGEAHCGSEVLALIERRGPELVLLDLHMPGLDGLDCLAQIRERWPEIKVVILSACDERATIDAALRAGASSYIVKSVSAVDIPSVLRQAATGGVYHVPSRPATNGADTQPDDDSAPLTDRETTILAAVADGLTTKAISKQLWVSEHTVKFHLTNIYRKLGVNNRSGAVRYALEHQLAAA